MGEGGGFALLYPALPSDRKRCCPGHLQRTYFPWTVTWQAFDVTLAGIAQITHHCLKKKQTKEEQPCARLVKDGGQGWGGPGYGTWTGGRGGGEVPTRGEGRTLRSPLVSEFV